MEGADLPGPVGHNGKVNIGVKANCPLAGPKVY